MLIGRQLEAISAHFFGAFKSQFPINMSTVQFMRESDNVVVAATPVTFEGLPGKWRSADPQTRGIHCLELTVCDGAVIAHTSGAVQNSLVDWGVAPISNLFADSVSSAKCAGFQLRYELGPVTSHIQASLKLGVLVLGVHQFFRAGRGRDNYFFREFLAVTEPVSESRSALPVGRSCGHDELLGNSPAAIQRFIGFWSNTNSRSRGIAGIGLDVSGKEAKVRVHGVGAGKLIDWGECTGEVFACIEEDRVLSAAILARYDFGFFDCELQIRQNKGILAVTTFNRFHDESGRSNYVNRELFHRESPSEV